jgi:hypothetical protein
MMRNTWLGRRFLYMVVENYLHRPSPWYTVHRIDPSQLFDPIPIVSPAPVEKALLPEPAMSFGNLSEDITFALVGRGNDKIVALDQMGRAVLYDDDLHAVAPLPSATAPKRWSTVSVRVGSVSAEDDGSVYVIETVPQADRAGRRSVEALVFNEKDERWAWRPIMPPPYVHDPGYGDDRSGEITCYAEDGNREGDGSLIWVSTAARGTYWLDTATGAWTKAGDWALPFRGQAVPAPELGLWLGFSAKDSGRICASDMFAALDDDRPPGVDEEWEVFKLPEGSSELQSYLVHLGYGRFCVAKLCDRQRQWILNCGCCEDREEESFAMFTGVEVVRGDHTGRWHRMIKHRTIRYSLGTDFHQCVL